MTRLPNTLDARTRSLTMAHNAPRHAARIGLAMKALEAGTAQTKGEAAMLAGTSKRALQPALLAPLLARAPELRALDRSSGILEHKTDCDGVEVSMRSVLTGCADASIRILHRVGRKADTELSKSEREQISRAKMLIQLAKDCGLWTEQGQSTMPAEVAAMMARDADRMSVESVTAVEVTRWNRHHGRQDGISPTALRQHHQTLTVETDSQDENPLSVGEGASG